MARKAFRAFTAALPSMLRFALIGLWAIPLTAHANLFVGNTATGAIDKYTNSGIAINLSLITGLERPRDIAIAGTNLFVLSNDGNVGVYTTSGDTLNASLITGLSHAKAIGVSDNNIFIGTDENNGTVAEYTTSGSLVNGSLITGLQSAFQFGFLGDLALSGGSLFVASWGTDNGLSYQGTVGKYTLSGLAVNPTLITNDGIATAMAVSGSQIFVRTSPDNMETAGIDTIGEYTISGALINASLITGLTNPVSMVVSGNNLYVAEANFADGIVGKYTTLGQPIDPTLVTGLGFPAITLTDSASSIPEPRATVWLALALASLLVTGALHRRRSLNLIGPKNSTDSPRDVNG